jgi:hypothetical protein
MYLNKRTGHLQATKPDNYQEERVEMTSFDYLTLADGTEITTYTTDEGERMYMDWDSQVLCLKHAL